MLVALIADQHFGVRKDLPLFLNNQEKFYNEIFFPTIDRLGIKTLINLGDTFDRRIMTNSNTLHRSKKMFFDKVLQRELKYISIIGNHDTYYKNTNDVNTPELFLQEYDFIHVREPGHMDFGNKKILLLPWITPENHRASLELLKKKEASIVMGHLEISGFEMDGGKVCDVGLSQSLFNDYILALSGHFHKKSKKGNIQYLGAPYQMTWNDYGQEKGFHILNLEDFSLEFIKNPYDIFYRLEYDEDHVMPTQDYKDCFVKIVVEKKTDQVKFDLFVDEIQKTEPHILRIEEKMIDEHLAQDFDVENIEDTPTIIRNYIDTLDIELDKEHFKSFMHDLYKESVHDNL